MTGIPLQGSRYTDDFGEADQRLRDILATGDAPRIVSEIAGARLLVAVVARLDSMDEDGADKYSHMALVSMVNEHGERGLLAFTGVDSMIRWDPQARPVPASGAQVAQAALAEGAQAVVIDVAGPQQVVLAEDVLRQVAGTPDR